MRDSYPLPLPEGAELTTSKDHAKLERPYYSYRVEMPREQLWTLVPKLLKDAGWTYYPDADPPRFGIAVREGKVVAVRMNGRLEGGSELSLQMGKPALLHAEGSCRQLQTCTDSVLRQVAPDSELASSMERHQMTVEHGRMGGCRTMLSVASWDLEDAEIKVEDSSSCFEIPITYAVQKRAAGE